MIDFLERAETLSNDAKKKIGSNHIWDRDLAELNFKLYEQEKLRVTGVMRRLRKMAERDDLSASHVHEKEPS